MTTGTDKREAPHGGDRNDPGFGVVFGLPWDYEQFISKACDMTCSFPKTWRLLWKNS